MFKRIDHVEIVTEQLDRTERRGRWLACFLLALGLASPALTPAEAAGKLPNNALEHWDRMPLEFQEQSVGRHKNSGALPGRDNEFDPPDLTATRNDGDLLIPESAHIRLAAAANNEGAQILRRPLLQQWG